MKKFLLTLLLAAFPLVAFAEVRTASFTIDYNLDSTTLIYCKETGLNGDPFGGTIAGTAKIKSVGSSVNVAEDTVGTNPFALLSVKDVIFVTFPDGTTATRTIVTRTSAAAVVLDVAVDLTGGFAFRWYKTVCGTTAADGWIDVSPYTDKTFIAQYEQGDLGGGLDVVWECKGGSPEAAPVGIYPGEADGCGGGTLGSGVCNFATATVGTKTNRFGVENYGAWNACRIGIAAHTNDPSDVGANLERVTISFQGRTRQ